MSTRTLVIAGTVLALALAAFAAPCASSAPDGLERVAADHGIAAAEHPTWRGAPLPDYQMPGITCPRLATGTAGVIGTLLVFLAAGGIGLWLKRQRPPAGG